MTAARLAAAFACGLLTALVGVAGICVARYRIEVKRCAS